jgi:glutathionylspermidine synthase
MNSPWLPVEPLPDHEFAAVRRRAIFDCDKWDPQVGDTCVVARHPLVISRDAWSTVAALAESLARETLAAEDELLQRPELWRTFRLPRRIRHALSRASVDGPPAAAARLMRFDFHFTSEGWRISEVNSDVPGGLNEASGFATLMAPWYPHAQTTGDPAGAYAEALAATAGPRATIACLHATAFSDDQQMMRALARRLEPAGHTVHLASPAHVRWQAGRASLAADWWRGPLDLVVRFFPSDWLSNLPRDCGWTQFYAGSRTPLSNPATAILSQHKRFPLVWDRLRASTTTWRSLLPDTHDPREVPWVTSDEWVLKPVLGRAGEGVCIRGIASDQELRTVARQVRWWPSAWVAQRRFETSKLEIAGQAVFPCLGVYTLDGRAIGAYGRIANRRLIDATAADAAVLAA